MNNQHNIIKNLSQSWAKPSKISPIVIIGTGGIVHDAHLPAYKKLDLKLKEFTILIKLRQKT